MHARSLKQELLEEFEKIEIEGGKVFARAIFLAGAKAGMECAKKLAKEHANDFSDQADELEKKPVSEFASAATQSNVVASYAQTAQECECIATAVGVLIKQLEEEG